MSVCKSTWRILYFPIVILFLDFLIFSASLANPLLTDRIIFTLNNRPYSQTQIERLTAVKECLRGQPELSQKVDDSNWKLALDSFVNDMMVHQEATKTSGFRPSRDNVEKLKQKCDENVLKSETLKVLFKKLQLSTVPLETEILRIATIENYRKNRNYSNKKSEDREQNWEKELRTRAVIRFFKDAQIWKKLQAPP